MLTGLVIVLCSAIAQAADWNALMEEAGKLQNQGAYAEAEQKFQDALAEAEKFGPTDRRLGLTLNNLGALSRAQGKYPLAEAQSYRALEIWSRTGGPVNTPSNGSEPRADRILSGISWPDGSGHPCPDRGQQITITPAR